MKNALILNPTSGGGQSLKLLPKIHAWAKSNNIDFEFYSTTRPGDGYRLGRICRLERFGQVIVVGGDGSINEVGSALLGSDIPLGVLPGGSGNDFYKMLGNNGNLKKAMSTAFDSRYLDVDVGLVNDRPFFNTVGIGFDAEVAMLANQSSKRGIAGYLAAVFKTWRNLRHLDIEIELDGVRLETDVTLVCIGNGRSSGGGFYLTPHARFDDGLFDICIIEALPKKRIFQYLPRTLNGSHIRLPGVKIYRSRKVTIRSLQKLPVHIDGEPMTDSINELEFKMDNRKLRVAAAGES